MRPSDANRTDLRKDAQAFDFDAFAPAFARAAAELGFSREVVAKVQADEIDFWTHPANVPDPLRVFVSAGAHGDEPAGPLAALRFLQETDPTAEFEWVFSPALNPSGLRLGTRENADGIDLNRDFLRRRATESRAFIDWWERQPQGCDLHLSLHEDWEANGFYFYAINSSPRLCYSELIRQKLEETVSLQQDGPVDGHSLIAPGLISHPCEADEPEGWPEAIWLAKRFPVLTYTFEAPSALPLQARVDGLVTALRAAISLARNSLQR